MKDICEALWTWRGGATQDALLEKSRKYFREHIFFSIEYLPCDGFIWRNVELPVFKSNPLD
jgi:hypothetical protein